MPTYRKRGKSYYLCWSENGEEHRPSLGPVSVGEAREAVRLKTEELRRRRMANIVEIPRGHMPTVSEFSTEYLAWHERQYPDSHERIRGIFDRHIVPFCGSTVINRVSKAQAERYIDKRLRDGRKSATIEKEIRAWNAMLNRAVYLEFIDRNPIKGVRAPRSTDSRPPRWYTADELEAIYANSKPLPGDEAAKGKPINSSVEDYAPIWRLMANTGMRRGEALQLKWRDVDKTVLRILSDHAARTKSGKWRQVPLSEGAAAALAALEAVTGKSAHVLPRMHPNSLSRALDTAVTRAGLDGTLHCLRHTFVAHLVMRGVPLRTVQVLAGHASVATTERYAHLAPDYLRDSVAGLKL